MKLDPDSSPTAAVVFLAFIVLLLVGLGYYASEAPVASPAHAPVASPAHAPAANPVTSLALHGGTPFGYARTVQQIYAISGAFLMPSAQVTEAELHSYQRPIIWLEYGTHFGYSGEQSDQLAKDILFAARQREAWLGHRGAAGIAPALHLESQVVRHAGSLPREYKRRYISEANKALADPLAAELHTETILRNTARFVVTGGSYDAIIQFANSSFSPRQAALLRRMGIPMVPKGVQARKTHPDEHDRKNQ